MTLYLTQIQDTYGPGATPVRGSHDISQACMISDAMTQNLPQSLFPMLIDRWANLTTKSGTSAAVCWADDLVRLLVVVEWRGKWLWIFGLRRRRPIFSSEWQKTENNNDHQCRIQALFWGLNPLAPFRSASEQDNFTFFSHPVKESWRMCGRRCP